MHALTYVCTHVSCCAVSCAPPCSLGPPLVPCTAAVKQDSTPAVVTQRRNSTPARISLWKQRPYSVPGWSKHPRTTAGLYPSIQLSITRDLRPLPPLHLWVAIELRDRCSVCRCHSFIRVLWPQQFQYGPTNRNSFLKYIRALTYTISEELAQSSFIAF